MDRERSIKHYRSSQKILLVGEGDFSFSACLAKAFGSAMNMVATSLDSRDTLMIKYQSFKEHLEELENKGCCVLHEIDVNEMHKHCILKHMKFDVIVFNFPHAGHFGLRESMTIIIQFHQDLLRSFFGSAREMLKEGGEVHIAHRDDIPYSRWNVAQLGREKGFVLKEKALFEKWDYPGYNNKRGSNSRADETFPLKDCFTFKFSLDLVHTIIFSQHKREIII